MVTSLGAPAPTTGAIRLFDLEEWHLDQTQTTQWYNGTSTIPATVSVTNPFNIANRTGVTIGSVLPTITGAEAFVYRITNINYAGGNGLGGATTFSFTNGVGINDLSGIEILDTHNALQASQPAANSQFMFTTQSGPNAILDLTPASTNQNMQDWDFNLSANAFSWHISTGVGAGVTSGFPSGIFGYAMPGNWVDAVNAGSVNSNGFPPATNLTPPLSGFSGPAVPEPSSLALVSFASLALLRRRR